jgi:hypothetical protein
MHFLASVIHGHPPPPPQMHRASRVLPAPDVDGSDEIACTYIYGSLFWNVRVNTLPNIIIIVIVAAVHVEPFPLSKETP